MTTDPNKTPPAKLVPANDSLNSVLAELRQLPPAGRPFRRSESRGGCGAGVSKQPAADGRARPRQNSGRPVIGAGRFSSRALPTAARPRYARAGTWVVAGGVTLACAALAIPLRSMIFDPLQQDAEVLVGAEPAVAKVEQRAPVEVASAIPEPAAKEPDVAAVEPDTTAPSTTASLAAQMPPKADPVLPSVEIPPVATSDLIRAEAPPAASVATQPVETASISLVKLPSELKPTAAGSVAAPSTIETASAGPVRAPSDARPSAAAAEGSPRDAVSTSDPKPDLGRSPVADASVPKASASDASSPSAGAVPASGPGIASDAGTAGTALSEVSADRKAGGSGPTRMAALGSVPERPPRRRSCLPPRNRPRRCCAWSSGPAS